MKKYRCLLPIALLIFFPVLLRAQTLDSMMNVYANNYPQEKIHIQFDKNMYNSGETIWFKAYIFSGADPSLYSKNFFAELSDPNGNIIQRKVYPITESSTAGNFDLPKEVKFRHLHFRAYTTWMTNFDTAFYYEKDIRIYDKKLDSAGTVTLVPRQIHLEFFPEGGDLVAGTESVVAFKANDQFGLPVSVKGVIQDKTGKEILSFAPDHDGMGKFMVSPDKGDVLTAVWKDDKGIEHRTELPEVKSSGAVLRVIPSNQKVLFSVARSSDGGPELQHLIIIAHMHQHLVYKAKINLEDNFMSGGTIPTSQLPSGVLQLTVFSSDLRPLAERVVFVNNHEFLFTPEIAVQMKGLARRAKNSLVIDVPDTMRSNLSLSVTDATADGEFPGDDNIISRLLVTGELRGYVHNPAYYFSGTADSLMSHLDLVMLTHGWRRFKWDNVAKGITPVIKNPEQNYLSIKVDVLGIDPYKISKDESLLVLLSKKGSGGPGLNPISVPHLSGSKFGLAGMVFFDTVSLYYQFSVNRALSSQAAVTFNNGLYKGFRMSKPLNSSFEGWTAEDSAYLRRNRYYVQEIERTTPINGQKVTELAAATVKAHVKSDKEKLDERYASGMFSGGDATVFDLVNDPLASAMMDIFMYLQGKVAGLQITPGQGPGGVPALSWRGGTPTLYLNEMQVDAQQLQSTPVSDIAMVKVFRPGSGVGFGGGGGGTIAVYTKKGGDDNRVDPNAKGLDKVLLLGYSSPKEFYSPNYLENSALNESSDLRTTLFWKPYVLTDKDNKHVIVDFFNNDITKKMRVVLEGFNEDGKLTRVEKIIQ